MDWRLTECRKLEVASLSREIQELKRSTPGASAQKVMLQQLLDDVNKKHAALEEKYLDVYQEKLVLESSLADVQQGHPIEGYGLHISNISHHTHDHDSTEVFQKMREQLSNAKRKASDVEHELAETKRQLLASQSDRMSFQEAPDAVGGKHANQSSVSMVGKTERDALEELKDSNSRESTELRSENSLLQKRSEGLEADLEEHKNLLRNALREKSDVQKMLSQQEDQLQETERSSNDLKATLDVLKAASAGRAEGHAEAVDEMLERHVKQLATKITKGRERLLKLTEVYHDVFCLEIILNARLLCIPRKG